MKCVYTMEYCELIVKCCPSPVYQACPGRRGTAGLEGFPPPYNCPPSQTWWAPAETPLNWPSPNDTNLRKHNSQPDPVQTKSSCIQENDWNDRNDWIIYICFVITWFSACRAPFGSVVINLLVLKASIVQHYIRRSLM